MPKKLDSFEFPHGGRKGMDIDFHDLGGFDIFDGNDWELERGVDWPGDKTADTFLGALSRAANEEGLRVNKSISEDKNIVRVRVKPKKEKKPATDAAEKKPAAVKK